jgi:uncharacterized phiE125 gp8 family phage protein
MILTQTEVPTAYPVTRDEVKANGRIMNTAEDAMIDAYIAAASDAVERDTGRAWALQTWTAVMDTWPEDDEIVIPMGPVSSVLAITYIDADGVEQFVNDDDYIVDTASANCRIKPVAAWPALSDSYNAVTVEFRVGPVDAPLAIRQAIMMLAQHWFENRSVLAEGQDMPLGVKWLLGTHRRMWV